MPSPVPAGYTRGSILFLGSAPEDRAQDALLQRFWQEAGAFGSRVVVLGCGTESAGALAQVVALLTDLEGEQAESLLIESRTQAQDGTRWATLAGATGVLLVGASPMRIVGILGGTLLAQTLRRMNAQGKVIAASGGGAPVLCQHMVAYDHPRADALPLVHRERIQFAPGLGMINRVVVEAGGSAAVYAGQPALGRLLTAVGYNPFLTGIGLEPGTGAALYANGQLEIFGAGTALVVDGSALTHTSLHDAEDLSPASLLGVRLHLLALGCTYSIESHHATAPNPSDVQLQSNAVKAAF